MNVRITSFSEPTSTVIRIAGRFRTEDVGELEREARSAEETLVLDVSELASADAAGVTLLKALMRRGTELRGASPYVALLLEGQQPPG